jgi:hypothetical protein
MWCTGRAGSNTAADHIAVTDLALAQIPAPARYGIPILISADGGGVDQGLADPPAGFGRNRPGPAVLGRGHRDRGVQAAIRALPGCAWTPAIEADGTGRDGADVAELTGLLPGLTAAGWPAGCG